MGVQPAVVTSGWSRPRAWGSLLWLGAFALALAVALGGLLTTQYSQAPRFAESFPAPGEALATGEVEMRVALPNLDSDRDRLLVWLDGERVPPEALSREEGAVLASASLPEGEHLLRVELRSANVFAGHDSVEIPFSVDTTTPRIELAPGQEPSVTGLADPIRFACSEDEVQAHLTLNGEEIPLWSEDGLLVAKTALEEGRYTAVLEVSDAAGNQVSETWELVADYNVPELAVADFPEELHEPEAAFRLRASDTDLKGLELEVQAPYASVLVEEEPRSGFPSEEDFGSEDALRKHRYYRVELTDLPEGQNRIVFRVRDAAGNQSEEQARIFVDSTSRFGARPMVLGAEGGDVVELQAVLARKAGFSGEATGVLDDETMAALVAYKKSQGLGDEPVFDQAVLTSLVGRIKIDLSERRLYFYEDGELARTYPVAVGQPRYPTPTGEYRIVNKARNPTWTPPPSPWADGLEPVPPGPGNPLGTRWMGLSAPHVGIHGTYASYSVGTAASHGCIRMYIRDVEELFELVSVGTPVDIVR
ncbi:MAG: hypothetical protein Kow00129_04700 [Thermoleophilia bacterium]